MLYGAHIIISFFATATAAASAQLSLPPPLHITDCSIFTAAAGAVPGRALHMCIIFICIYVLDNQSDMNGIYNAAARVAEELEIMCM